MEDLIAKGKRGDLSASELDDAMEEMGFDIDSIDHLYESLGGALPGNIPSAELHEIETEVEKLWKRRKYAAHPGAGGAGG